MSKKVLIGVLLVAIMLMITGCGLSGYLKEKEEASPLEKGIEEVEEEIAEETPEEAIEEVAEGTAEETAPEEISKEVDEEEYITITVKENETVSLKPKAIDEDNDTITYTFSEPLDANGVWKTTFGDAGEYIITITASDGKLETTQNVLLIVERVNVAPIIEDIKDIIVDEGDTITLEPKVKDLNKDDVTVTISEPIGDDGVWETDYKSAGEYKVTITAEDSESKTEKVVKLTVNKKNVAPIIADIDDIEVDEGETVTITPIVSDLNGDNVTVTISEPVGDDGIWDTSYTDHGIYDVTITATDGKLTSTKTVKVTVNDVNVPPKIIEIINKGE